MPRLRFLQLLPGLILTSLLISLSACGAPANPAGVTGGSIAFLGEAGQAGATALYLLGPGAGEPSLLARQVVDFAWSPDGRKIAYRSQTGYQIYLLNADGAGRRPLTPAGRPSSRPVWSPDSRQIAYTTVCGDQAQIYVVDVYGAGKHLLVSDGSRAGSPVWSPDGRRLFFVRWKTRSLPEPSALTDPLELYVVNSDGTGERRLVRSPAGGRIDAFAVAPDGRRLVFVEWPAPPDAVGHSGNFTLHLLDLATLAVTPLTTTSGIASHLAWSPDGRRLAYVVTTNERPLPASTVYLLNATGSAPQPLNLGRAPINAIAWSPDGTRLAVSSGALAVITPGADPAGAQVVRVSAEGEHDYSGAPGWSPDGRTLVYAAHRNGGFDLYQGQVTGSGAARLTFDGIYKSAPAWQPVEPPAGR